MQRPRRYEKDSRGYSRDPLRRGQNSQTGHG